MLMSQQIKAVLGIQRRDDGMSLLMKLDRNQVRKSAFMANDRIRRARDLCFSRKTWSMHDGRNRLKIMEAIQPRPAPMSKRPSACSVLLPSSLKMDRGA